MPAGTAAYFNKVCCNSSPLEAHHVPAMTCTVIGVVLNCPAVHSVYRTLKGIGEVARLARPVWSDRSHTGTAPDSPPCMLLPPPGATSGTVYVLDTGVRTSHIDFKGRVGDGATTVGGSTTDDNGHGTHVAGAGSTRPSQCMPCMACITTQELRDLAGCQSSLIIPHGAVLLPFSRRRPKPCQGRQSWPKHRMNLAQGAAAGLFKYFQPSLTDMSSLKASRKSGCTMQYRLTFNCTQIVLQGLLWGAAMVWPQVPLYIPSR